MKNFKHWYNASPFTGEVNDDPSETIAGESYTIAELMHRNSNGLVTSKSNQAFYPKASDYDDPDLDEVSRMDILDKAEVLLKASDNITSAKKAIDEAKAKKEADEASKLDNGEKSEPSPA